MAVSGSGTLTANPSPPTIIVGDGVIGLSTAYYLALSLGDGSSITIIDNAPELLLRASGGALGALGYDDYSKEITPLALLSYNLQKELSEKFNSRTNWGYWKMVAHELSMRNSLDKEREKRPLPSWFRNSEEYVDRIKYDGGHAARLRSRQFCGFIRRQCELLGVKILLNTSVTAVNIENDAISSANIHSSAETSTVPCQNLVLSAGPWTHRVLAGLFPSSKVQVPMNVTYAAGHHLNIKVPSSDDKKPYCDQLFHTLDLTDFLGG